ncbi:hypothetical protein C7C56_026415 [Massilia glaciei]|uniref:Uncharacterized protein n=1 Tax=Massilia glaciei TaxID=1524097 RepID=A0A2U2HAY8_9BURK|nr:hypothetical protein C7C56_026415 [Massilia glaciei]
MRIKIEMVTVVAILLGAITLAGVGVTDKFPQAARAESVGFDALAHAVFGGAAPAPQRQRSSPEQAQ